MNAEVSRALDRLGVDLPTRTESIRYLSGLGKPTVVDLLSKADRAGDVLVQPRCGVGGHGRMLELLHELEANAGPAILSVTIDSHTRLGHFEEAERILAQGPENLNGYPLVAHGWQRGRELNEQVLAPLQIRHGSPDPRVLFEVSLAAGVTAFEGGGIGYNVPYCRDVPIEQSLNAWCEVDEACGALAATGVVVDRELFGTLTGVLMPPAIALAMPFLEAIAAVRVGVRCISIAYPQSGHLVQDIAALAAVRTLAAQLLPADVLVFTVLHQFMGPFPKDRADAEALIFFGGMVARKGGATKVVNKTRDEAIGIPDAGTNAAGIWSARAGASLLLDAIDVPQDRVEEEEAWVVSEVRQLLDPALQGQNLFRSIAEGFAAGRLDVPFSASRYARSEVLPMRDAEGAIRFFDVGQLPFDQGTVRRHQRLLRGSVGLGTPTYQKVWKDVMRFCSTNGVFSNATPSPRSRGARPGTVTEPH